LTAMQNRPVSCILQNVRYYDTGVALHHTNHFQPTVLTVARMLQRCARLSPSSVVCTEFIVAKRCVLGQNLLLTAFKKSYMRNRLVPKWMTLTSV